MLNPSHAQKLIRPNRLILSEDISSLYMEFSTPDQARQFKVKFDNEFYSTKAASPLTLLSDEKNSLKVRTQYFSNSYWED